MSISHNTCSEHPGVAAYMNNECPAESHCTACHRLYIGYVELCPIHSNGPELLAVLEAILPQSGLVHDADCPSKPGSLDYDPERCNGCAHARARAVIDKAHGLAVPA